MAVTVRRGISKRSHEKIRDCEQSIFRWEVFNKRLRYFRGCKLIWFLLQLFQLLRDKQHCLFFFDSTSHFRNIVTFLLTTLWFLRCWKGIKTMSVDLISHHTCFPRWCWRLKINDFVTFRTVFAVWKKWIACFLSTYVSLRKPTDNLIPRETRYLVLNCWNNWGI